jgi:hypothetical protein
MRQDFTIFFTHLAVANAPCRLTKHFADFMDGFLGSRPLFAGATEPLKSRRRAPSHLGGLTASRPGAEVGTAAGMFPVPVTFWRNGAISDMFLSVVSEHLITPVTGAPFGFYRLKWVSFLRLACAASTGTSSVSNPLLLPRSQNLRRESPVRCLSLPRQTSGQHSPFAVRIWENPLYISDH